MQALERQRKAAPPSDNVVAFYGGSSIRLWSSLADDFSDINTINLGFGGATLEGCVWFFERLVVPCNPRSLIFYAGDNDLGDGQTPDQVIHSFHTLLEKIDRHLGSIPFGFLSIKPSPARWYLIDNIRRTNATIERDLASRATSSYIDIFHPMLGNDGMPRHELFADDGLHLSPQGYSLWKQVVAGYRGTVL